MDKNDQHLEEFFIKSMEQFDDIPDDSIWSAIDQSLDNERTVWDEIRGLGRKFGLPILLVGMLAYLYYSQTKIDRLQSELVSMQSQVDGDSEEQVSKGSELSTAPDLHAEAGVKPRFGEEKSDLGTTPTPSFDFESAEVNVHSGDLEGRSSEFSDLSKFKSEVTKPARSTDADDEIASTELDGKRRALETINKSRPRGVRKSEDQLATGSTAKEKQDSESSGVAAANSTIAIQDSRVETAVLDQGNGAIRDSQLMGRVVYEPLPAIESNGDLGAAQSLNAWRSHDLVKRMSTQDVKSVRSRRKGNLLKGLFDWRPIEVNSAFGLDYAFGLTARTFHTMVKDGKHFSPGFSVGFVQELRLGGKLFLTNGLRYNRQQYRIVGGLTPGVDQMRVDKFPGGMNFESNVAEIIAASSYLDLPLGLKWTFANDKNANRYYINPALVWQLYFPQNFSYKFIQGGEAMIIDKRYFAYMGSFNVELGVEKYLSKNSSWHMGLWMERSLIPLGVEDEVITMFGLSTSLVFGK